MNIAFYTDQTISGMTGGIGRVTDVLTRYFRQSLGWKVFSVYAAEAAADCVPTPVDDAIMLRLHDRLGLRSDVRRNTLSAAQWLVERRVDVLIVQTSMEVVARIKRELQRLGSPMKVVGVLHFEPGKDEWPWKGGSLFRRLLAPLRNWAIHRATVRGYRSALLAGDGVSVLSPSYIESYIDYCGLLATECIQRHGGKFFALPNPLSFAETLSKPELRQKLPIMLVVARMEESQKRISQILKMWHHWQHSGYQLVLVGDGPSLPMYQTLAKSLELENVSFEGRQDPLPYYRAAQIFLMTSAFEGFPMTLVEAQQQGCVPVAYRSFAALDDVITDGVNGCIVENGDEMAFEQQVTRLMVDGAYREHLALGALRDCQRFSVETLGQQWKTILEGL